jgi:hypothetical protein
MKSTGHGYMSFRPLYLLRTLRYPEVRAQLAGYGPAALRVFSQNDIHVLGGDAEFHEGVRDVFSELTFLVRIKVFPHFYCHNRHNDLPFYFFKALGP